jgi:transketolase N-terminal domain/subunit
MTEWSAYYSIRKMYPAPLRQQADSNRVFVKGNLTTKYYATLEEYGRRTIDELHEYKDHVTHCTPCNLDPSRNYVSMEYYPAVTQK